jgi:soluble lytic murein transglycosylase-like protein
MKSTWMRLVAIALAASAAAPARGELVVLTDGSFFKVAAYEVVGSRMKLSLPSGGRLSLSLSRVERVVDDEVVPEPEPMPEPDVGEGPLLRFGSAPPVPETPYGLLIYQAAERHDVSPLLVAAVVRAESAFDAQALSHKGARGLMQLMPATAQRFGVRHSELFEPARNLEAGTRYLSWLLERYGEDLPRILAAYNAGEGAVARYGGVPPYRETRDYIRRIYKTLDLSLEAPEIVGAL